jgi:hypothetical protein
MPDARHTTIHAWFNTFTSVLALLVAGASAYIAWRGDLLRRENISAATYPAGSCRFTVDEWIEEGGRRHNSLITCWSVTIANTSDLRLSIVDAAPGLAPGNHHGIHFLENDDGSPLDIPFALEGGQARSFIVHWYLHIPDQVADIVEKFPDYKLGTLSSFTVDELHKRLRAYQVDLLGNEVDDADGWHKNGPWKDETGDFQLGTGRGTRFTIDVKYPWITHRVVTQ